MAGLSDILTTIQNGVVALNNLGSQVKGSLLNISSQLIALQAAPAITAGPWTVWTPTVIPGAGAFTTVSATGGFFAIGKIVQFSVTITITTVGTAAGTMTIALPVGTAKRNAAVFAQDFGATGNVGFGRIIATQTTISSILKYDNSTYIAAGNNVVFWIDTFVPRGTTAGLYAGTYTVSSGRGSVTGQIKVNVWNFTLPLKTSLHTNFNRGQRNGNRRQCRNDEK